MNNCVQKKVNKKLYFNFKEGDTTVFKELGIYIGNCTIKIKI